jgi:hypothetical protein
MNHVQFPSGPQTMLEVYQNVLEVLVCDAVLGQRGPSSRNFCPWKYITLEFWKVVFWMIRMPFIWRQWDCFGQNCVSREHVIIKKDARGVWRNSRAAHVVISYCSGSALRLRLPMGEIGAAWSRECGWSDDLRIDAGRSAYTPIQLQVGVAGISLFVDNRGTCLLLNFHGIEGGRECHGSYDWRIRRNGGKVHWMPWTLSFVFGDL